MMEDNNNNNSGIKKRIGQLVIPFLHKATEENWRKFKRDYAHYAACETEKAPVAMHMLVDKSVQQLIQLLWAESAEDLDNNNNKKTVTGVISGGPPAATAAAGSAAAAAAADGAVAVAETGVFVLTTELLIEHLDKLYKPVTKQDALEKCKMLRMEGTDMSSAVEYIALWDEVITVGPDIDEDSVYADEILVKQFVKGLEPAMLREIVTNGKCSNLTKAKRLTIKTIKEMYTRQAAVGKYFSQAAASDKKRAHASERDGKDGDDEKMRHKKFKTERSNNIVPCSICKKNGHAEKDCFFNPLSPNYKGGDKLKAKSNNSNVQDKTSSNNNNNNADKTSKNNNINNNNTRDKGACFTCGKIGHKRRDCPNKEV
jgi:hypothetical protein